MRKKKKKARGWQGLRRASHLLLLKCLFLTPVKVNKPSCLVSACAAKKTKKKKQGRGWEVEVEEGEVLQLHTVPCDDADRLRESLQCPP